jgi:hypothetical protein
VSCDFSSWAKGHAWQVTRPQRPVEEQKELLFSYACQPDQCDERMVVCPSEARVRCQPHFIRALALGPRHGEALVILLTSALGFLPAWLLSLVEPLPSLKACGSVLHDEGERKGAFGSGSPQTLMC